MNSGANEPKRGVKRKNEFDNLLLENGELNDLGLLGDYCKRVTRSSLREKKTVLPEGAAAASGSAPTSPLASPSSPPATTAEPRTLGKSPGPHQGTSKTSKDDTAAEDSAPERQAMSQDKQVTGYASALSPPHDTRQLQVQPQDFHTPKQAKVLNESMDCAPSPMTPWMSKMQAGALNDSIDCAPSPITPLMPKIPEPVTVSSEVSVENIVPSPHGMSLPQLTSLTHEIESVLVKEKTLPSKEEPCTSKTVVGKAGLDLDRLIDEIFVRNSSNLGSELNRTDNSLSMDIGSFDITLESPVSGTDTDGLEQVGNKSISSDTVEAGGPDLYSMPTDTDSSAIPENQPQASCPVSKEDKTVLNSETASCAGIVNSRPNQKSPAGAQMEHPNDTLSLEQVKISQTPVESILKVHQTITQGLSALCVNSTEESNSLPQPMESASALNSEEPFTEELRLSDSQYMAIDEKCSLIKDDLQAPPPSHITAHPKPLRESDTGIKFSAQGISSLPSLGFSVPPAPRMDWIAKTLDSRQRLRMLTQEVSRLNAMVLRARRTLWPRQKPNLTFQGNQITQTLPERQVPQMRLPDLSKEPDWNIC